MEYFENLKESKIFNSISETDCQAMMFCLKTKFKTYNKMETIIAQNEPLNDVVLIIKGSANVENIDYFGNISILKRLKKGDIYGVEYALSEEKFYRNNLIATEKTVVMFMDKFRLLNPCENRCKRHEIVSKRISQIIANDSVELNEKLLHMAKKTIKGKLLSYFNALSEKNNSNYFEIPFNKTELANYLGVDRSAMCTELSKMKNEKLIDFEKKQFRIFKFEK